MSQVFALQDLASILAAFPPSPPTSQEPSLLWSNDGEHLLQSTKIQERFVKLLRESSSRIELSKLPASMGTRTVDWLLRSSVEPILYNVERNALICAPESEKLISKLRDLAQQQALHLSTFASEHDVDSRSLKAALERESDPQILEDLASKSRRTWVMTNSLYSSTQDRIEDLLRNAGSDHKVDLSANLPGVPKFVIQRLAEQLSHEKAIPGTVRLGKTRVTFRSEAYDTRIEDERAKKIARQFSKILVQTHKSGYHHVPEDTEDAPGLQKVFFERTKAGIDDGSFSMISSGDNPIALAFTNRLEAVLSEMKVSASDMLVETWKSKTGLASTSLDDTRLQKLVDGSSSQEFAKLILEDAKYRAAIEASMSAKLEELESEDVQRYNTIFNDYVRSPIRLYLIGINNVQEQSLRQRLEDFVLEFLRKDLIPTGIQLTQDDKLRNRPFGKELERFSQACTEAKVLIDIQNAVSKFARKQKLDSISELAERAIKKDILEQKAKSLKKMVRASDILQNLVWILLAKELPGIFISSGRDTTRMIRFYQGLDSSDVEKGKRLEAWKDRFKEGQETREDIENMRAMAEEVVGQIAAATQQNGMHESG